MGPQMTRVLRALLLGALAMWPGCGYPPDPLPAQDEVLTLEHFAMEGHRRALARAAAEEGLGGLYAEVSGAIVRVQLQYDAKDPGRTTTSHGSGVVVGGGRYVATAGHVVDLIDSRPEARARVVLTDGRIVAAAVVAWRDVLDDDWALLRLVDPPPGLLSLEFGRAEPGARALLLGYPSSIGMAPDGEARADRDRSPMALAPVACVVSVEGEGGHDVRPIAGAVLGNGLSGGPIVDPGRRVVGIQHRITTHHDSGDAWFTHGFDDTLDLQQALRTELAR